MENIEDLFNFISNERIMMVYGFGLSRDYQSISEIIHNIEKAANGNKKLIIKDKKSVRETLKNDYVNRISGKYSLKNEEIKEISLFLLKESHDFGLPIKEIVGYTGNRYKTILMLENIINKKGSDLKSIAKNIGVEIHTAKKIAYRLEKIGFLTYAMCKNDGNYYSLTGKENGDLNADGREIKEHLNGTDKVFDIHYIRKALPDINAEEGIEYLLREGIIKKANPYGRNKLNRLINMPKGARWYHEVGRRFINNDFKNMPKINSNEIRNVPYIEVKKRTLGEIKIMLSEKMQIGVGYTPKDIAKIMELKSRPSEMLKKLVGEGFLKKENGLYSLRLD